MKLFLHDEAVLREYQLNLKLKFRKTFLIIVSFSDVVLIIPRCNADSTVGIVCAPGLNSLVFKDLLFGFALMYVALPRENPVHTQILINMAYDYAYMEGYELQQTKNVALNIKAKPNKRSLNTREFKLGAQTML
jgi:hypothetical protein